MSENFLIEEDNAPDTYVKKSNVSGLGLYAIKDFKKGDVIIDYNLFPESWYELDYIDLSEDKIKRSRFVMINNSRCITSDKISKFGYLNHSRNPNCKCLFEKRLVIADKDIQKDEELFIDYRLEPRPNRVEFPNWI
jgi:SET domain-containing protein